MKVLNSTKTKSQTQTSDLKVTKLSVRFARCFLCFINSTDRCLAKPRHRSTVPCSSSCLHAVTAVHLQFTMMSSNRENNTATWQWSYNNNNNQLTF